MKNKYIMLLGLSLLMSFTSCSDFLDEKPHSFIDPNMYFNTYEEADAALLGVYDKLHDQQIGDFGWQYRGDAGVDIGICRNIMRYNVYQYYEMEALPTQIIDCWKVHFKAIGDANMVINRTAEMNLPDKQKNLIIGQARFLRAFYYHQLTLMWGDVPLFTEEVTGENQDEIASLPRTPIKDVYEQMIEDLSFSVENLPEKYGKTDEGRITKYTAMGLLARIYLFNKQYKEASVTAQELINSSEHKLLDNFADIFNRNNAWNKEILFAVACMKDVRGQWLHTVSEPSTKYERNITSHDFSKSLIVLPNGETAKTAREVCSGWSIFTLVPEYYQSFAEGDKRRDATFWSSVKTTDGKEIHFTNQKHKGDGTQYFNLKWVSLGDTEVNGDKDIIMMRLAEVYLILAEAENEINHGPNDIAYNAINKIRERAFGDSTHNLSNLSYESFRKAIIDENKWELGGEGLRAWYLRHWGFNELKNAVESVKASNPKAAANLKAHHMLYKIPDEEFVKNPNLAPNNPGY